MRGGDGKMAFAFAVIAGLAVLATVAAIVGSVPTKETR